MITKNRLISLFSIFILILGIFSINTRTSLAITNCSDATNNQGICLTKDICSRNGGSPFPGSIQGPESGCNGEAICCVGSLQCESPDIGGKCTTSCPSSNTKQYFCPGGPTNLCCFDSTTQAPPEDTSTQSLSSGLTDYQNEIQAGNNITYLQTYMATRDLMFLAGPVLGLTPKDSSKTTALAPDGILGITTNAIASLYSPPASGIKYLAQVKDNFLGKPAYAQGTGPGFRGLQPILSIWRGFRNVIYILFSLILIVIGIMIMLRIKISPQAVITIQSAIPKLITTLILVTFSYAIAGLLIDLSYFIQNLALAVLFQTQGNGLTGTLVGKNFTELSASGFGTTWDLMYKLAPNGWGFIASVGGLIGGLAGFGTGVMGGISVLGGVAGTGWLTLIGVPVGMLILYIVISIIIFIWLIKFFFGLIKCYVMIIFKIILAPLEIGIGAFPNLKIGFSTWIIDLISQLSVFPISYLFLIIANILVEKTKNTALWIPNLLEGNIVSSAAGLAGGIVSLCISLAALALLSKLPSIIPEAIYQLKPSPWGKGIGEGFAGVGIGGKGSAVGKIGGQIGLNQLANINEARYGEQTKATDAGTPGKATAGVGFFNAVFQGLRGVGVLPQKK